jgi:GNAT superfamily N-acetyltransferase
MKFEIDNAYIEFDKDILEENTVEISMLFVPENMRGQKVGYKLIAKVEEWAKANNYEQLSLCAYPQEDNGITEDALIDYYAGYGFEQYECSEIMYMSI